MVLAAVAAAVTRRQRQQRQQQQVPGVGSARRGSTTTRELKVRLLGLETLCCKQAAHLQSLKAQRDWLWPLLNFPIVFWMAQVSSEFGTFLAVFLAILTTLALATRSGLLDRIPSLRSLLPRTSGGGSGGSDKKSNEGTSEEVGLAGGSARGGGGVAAGTEGSSSSSSSSGGGGGAFPSAALCNPACDQLRVLCGPQLAADSLAHSANQKAMRLHEPAASS
mmetsp:Transcript_35253/g.59447  ORF Transcript_35253/g.59447 Transcript_35253/m.59447 type:complete len:221 (-) Transcript_35253:241-903(-)